MSGLTGAALPPMSSDEAAEIVEQDQALRDAGGDDEEDPAADERP
jgi:hypothetical protein